MAKVILKTLTAEIDRVVDSPYPTQLKTLYDILKKSTSIDIESWSLSSPCQIQSLVSEVLAALQIWPYALDIIISLSSCRKVRDVFLESEPLLVNQIVSKAVDENDADYIRASVALLQHSLPENVALPAASQILLVRLFKQAAVSPRKTHVRDVYTVLSGACRPLLDLLSSETLQQFQSHTFEILNEATDSKSQSLALYCLSIIRILIEGSQSISHSDSQRLTLSSPRHGQWKPDALKAFFAGVKAHKTLLLLVLRTVTACKLESQSAEEAYTCVRLANYVLGAIDDDIKRDWCHRNQAVERKLLDKALLPNVPPAVRLQAFAFIAGLCEPSKISKQMSLWYWKILADPSGLAMNDEELRTCLDSSLHAFVSGTNGDLCRELLEGILDNLAGRKYASASASSSLVMIIEKMTETIGSVDSEPLHSSVVEAISVQSTFKNLHSFLTTPDSPLLPGLSVDNGVCTVSVQLPVQRLGKSLCGLVLRAGLAAQSEEQQLPADLVLLLLAKHSEPGNHSSCVHAHRRRQDHPAQFANASLIPNITNVRDWRIQLAANLQTEGIRQTDAMVSTVEMICQGLEDRCNNVEEPLRVEREQKTDIEQRYRELEEAYGSLEGQMMDRDLRISALEAECDRNASKSQTNAEENATLVCKIDEAHLRLKQLNDTARAEIEDMREKAHEADMQHATTLARRQEALDHANEELHQSRRHAQSIELSLQNEKEIAGQTEDELKQAQQRLQGLTQQFDSACDSLKRSEISHEAITKEKTDFQQQIETYQNELDVTRKELDSIRAQAEETEVHSRQELEQLRQDFTSKLSEERQSWAMERHEIDEQMNQLSQEQRRAQEVHEAEQQTAEAKIHDQRRRIDKLTRDLSKKDAQISEAQDMRNKLMTAMGINPPSMASKSPPPKHASLPYRSLSSASTQYTQPPHTPGRTHDRPTQDADHSLQSVRNLSFDSAASSQAEGGPTPKRAKPRKAFKVPSLAPPRHNASTRSALRGASALKRLPLGNVNANANANANAERSPGKVAFKIAKSGGADMRRDSDIDVHMRGNGRRDAGASPMGTGRETLAHWSFGTECLTSTPGVGLRGVAGDGDEFGDLDESTADV